ncbi:hypothetical protein [Poseidonibacter ostreae]|uniref:Uncharacterized protein n=1 Tax=Poseidonibacter ostreae TaxID=2654171 RepID=A0A6L4WZ61_9BACT|nr:hypothetical protein [Poseidonibacter ostreae]KAB7891284.1 hypothetical protein GBG19_00175 [Poseidonibacter ostreae]
MSDLSQKNKDDIAHELSFQVSDIWGEFHSETLKQMETLNKTIENRFQDMEKTIEDKTSQISESLTLMNSLGVKFEKELVNLNTLKDLTDSFKGSEIKVINPTMETILEELGKGLEKETKELTKETKENQEKLHRNLHSAFNDSVSEITNTIFNAQVDNIHDVSKKIDKKLATTLSVFETFEESMKKGNDSILQSENIVAKLLYSLRFLEKLSPETRESIINLDSVSSEKVAHFINEIKDTETKEELKEENSKEEIKDTETKEELKEETKEEELKSNLEKDISEEKEYKKNQKGLFYKLFNRGE